jgi:hypothetical protein
MDWHGETRRDARVWCKSSLLIQSRTLRFKQARQENGLENRLKLVSRRPKLTCFLIAAGRTAG